MTDVKRVVKAIRGKLGRYTQLFDYYDGDHPMVYTNRRMSEIFGSIETHIFENWCAVVIDTLLDRIVLESARVAGSGSRMCLTGCGVIRKSTMKRTMHPR